MNATRPKIHHLKKEGCIAGVEESCKRAYSLRKKQQQNLSSRNTRCQYAITGSSLTIRSRNSVRSQRHNGNGHTKPSYKSNAWRRSSPPIPSCTKSVYIAARGECWFKPGRRSIRAERHNRKGFSRNTPNWGEGYEWPKAWTDGHYYPVSN